MGNRLVHFHTRSLWSFLLGSIALFASQNLALTPFTTAVLAGVALLTMCLAACSIGILAMIGYRKYRGEAALREKRFLASI